MPQKQICEDWCFPKTTGNTLIKECEQYAKYQEFIRLAQNFLDNLKSSFEKELNKGIFII